MTEDDTKSRPTQPPPSAQTEPAEMLPSSFGELELLSVPGAARLPRESLKPDPNSWEHRQLQILVEALSESKAAREAALEPEALLAQARAEFQDVVTAGYEMLRVPMGETLAEMRALVPRVASIEQRLDAGDDRFQRIELDMAAMRSQMDRLDRELAILKASASGAG